MRENSTFEWAQQTFSHAKLGDSRRTQRLVQLASDMASHVGANAIAEAGFAATTNETEAHDLLLALEDSTALTYRPTDLQTYRPTDLQTYRPTDLQTYRPTDLQTYRPTDLQTYRPTEYTKL